MPIVNSSNYRDYAASAWLDPKETLPEKILRVERGRNKLYCQNPNKWEIFANLIGMIENDRELAEVFEIHEDEFLWQHRIVRKKNIINTRVIELCQPCEFYPSLPKCYDTTGQNFPGLYFLGATYFVPTTKQPIYAVKIGVSYSSVGSRIASYGTHNPFIYHTRDMALPFEICDDADEATCHKFLASLAVQQIDKETEWYIVDEKTYFFLCENMRNVEFFANVATGKIRAI